MKLKHKLLLTAFAVVSSVVPVLSQGIDIKSTTPSMAQKDLLGIETNNVVCDNTVTETEIVSINTYIFSLKTDKKVKKEKKEKKDTPETIYDLYSEDEIEVLHRIVEAECTNQDIDCKMNVANVIINRVESDSFPDTIKDVVFQKRQFSPISDGRYWEVEISKDTIKACEDIFMEKDTVEGAVFFCNPRDVKNNSTQSWFKKLTYIKKDSSGHHFYK